MKFFGYKLLMGTSNLTGKRIKNTNRVPLSDHLLQYNCPITFDDLNMRKTVFV